MPTRGVGILFERLDAPLVDRNQMRKGSVEWRAALLAAAAIAAGHQQAAVGEVEELFRFGARLEMPGNLAPAVAPHGYVDRAERDLVRAAVEDFAAESTLNGHVWVANFMFTNCPGPCPRMSSQMHEVQTALAGQDVKLVSITVDPERDTPEKLAKYAAFYNATPGVWYFLTGPPISPGRPSSPNQPRASRSSRTS